VVTLRFFLPMCGYIGWRALFYWEMDQQPETKTAQITHTNLGTVMAAQHVLRVHCAMSFFFSRIHPSGFIVQCHHEHEGGLLLESEPFMREYHAVVVLTGIPHEKHMAQLSL
jgi:hypothetical protein